MPSSVAEVRAGWGWGVLRPQSVASTGSPGGEGESWPRVSRAWDVNVGRGQCSHGWWGFVWVAGGFVGGDQRVWTG